MNAKKFQISLILVLAVLFANTALVSAYPAEPPDPPSVPRTVTTSPCTAMAANAAQIDIPSRSADYTALNKLAGCGVVAGVSIVPVTGSQPDGGKQRYEDFKILQAERMSE